MNIEDVRNVHELRNFLIERDMKTVEGRRDLLQIDNSHYIKIKEVHRLDATKANKEGREYFGTENNVIYEWLIDTKGTKHYIIRNGNGTSTKCIYKKKGNYSEPVRRRLLQSLNSVHYMDDLINESFDALFKYKLRAKDMAMILDRSLFDEYDIHKIDNERNMYAIKHDDVYLNIMWFEQMGTVYRTHQINGYWMNESLILNNMSKSGQHDHFLHSVLTKLEHAAEEYNVPLEQCACIKHDRFGRFAEMAFANDIMDVWNEDGECEPCTFSPERLIAVDRSMIFYIHNTNPHATVHDIDMTGDEKYLPDLSLILKIFSLGSVDLLHGGRLGRDNSIIYASEIADARRLIETARLPVKTIDEYV